MAYNQAQHNMSVVLDREKDNLLLVENNELKKNNESLLMEKKKLIEELKSAKVSSTPKPSNGLGNNINNG